MKELFKSWRETQITTWSIPNNRERSSYRGLIVEALGGDVDLSIKRLMKSESS